MRNSRVNRRENSASSASKQDKPKFDSSESESYSSPTQRGEAHRCAKSSKRRNRGASTTTNVFFNFLMGAGLATEKDRHASQIEDEPFVFVNALDRFGLYDSTDTEISELRYPVKERVSYTKVTIKEPVSHPKEIKKEISKEDHKKPSKSFDEDQESIAVSIEEKIRPEEIISAEGGSQVSEEDKSEQSKIISIEERFASSSLNTESEASSTSKEESGSKPSGESNNVSDKNTFSSQSTRSSEESAEPAYENPPEVDYRDNNKTQRKTTHKAESDQDIYRTPESSATKVLKPGHKESDTTKLSTERKQKNKESDATKLSTGLKQGNKESDATKLSTGLKQGHKESDTTKLRTAPKTDEDIKKIKGLDSLSRIIDEELDEFKNKNLNRLPIVKEIQKATDPEEEQRAYQSSDSRLKDSAKQRLSRLLESQMSDDRRRSPLDKQNSRYSREPPERDQNYDDSLMKKNYPQSTEIHQGSKPWCACKNTDDCRRLNHQQYPRKNYPEHRRRTTYDLVKSAENLRQQNQEQNKSSCTCSAKSKQGQLSQSSPEVSRNKQNMKSEDPCNADTCEYYSDYAGKNEGYAPNQMEHMKLRKYPYEEPLQGNDYNNENHDRNCACDHCNRRNRYRNCKCCNCLRNDDQASSYSDDSQSNLNLAYQKSEDYPELVDEIENSISRRNKERVKKTMRQFEMLSRQNKSLEKPIYDEDEEDDNVNRFACNKRTCPMYNNRPRSREAQYYNNQKPRPPCCYDRRNYQTKSECLSERPAFNATPFPRTRGYVEKVAKYMDPSMTDTAQKYPRYRPEYSNSRWQMDPRSGEWVKVCDDGYDFENNYPPLPAPPVPMYNNNREGGAYRDYENYPKNQGNPNYFNTPNLYRTPGPFKHSSTPTKQCQCRNCMQPSNNSNNRY